MLGHWAQCLRDVPLLSKKKKVSRKYIISYIGLLTKGSRLVWICGIKTELLVYIFLAILSSVRIFWCGQWGLRLEAVFALSASSFMYIHAHSYSEEWNMLPEIILIHSVIWPNILWILCTIPHCTYNLVRALCIQPAVLLHWFSLVLVPKLFFVWLV